MIVPILLACALDVVAGNPGIEVLARPSPAYVEETATGRALNFDIIVVNGTAADVTVDEIKLSVYDSRDALVLRRLIDGNGTRPSIRTIDAGPIPPGASQLLFNPFHHFDPDVELGRLVYDLELSGKGGEHTAQLVVRPVARTAKTALVLPVAGRLIVYDGHDFYAHHRRWDYMLPGIRQLGFTTNFMRYSYDLAPVDARGEMSSGDPAKNESWPGFGRAIRAAGDGRVAAVVDANPDDRQFDPSTLLADRMKIWGNYVVIDHGNGEFSLYGHIQKGSARVKVGDRVKGGAPIAAIGASGSSMFPHLHFELQTGIDTESEGLPSTFRGFDRIRGTRRIFVKAGAIETGEIVESR